MFRRNMEDGKFSSPESDSPKRKRFNDSGPEDNHDDISSISTRKVSDVENGSTDEDGSDQRQELGQDYRMSSDGLEMKVQSIRQKMEAFNHHVSGLLEEGKNYFLDAASAFEKQVVLLHQKQIDKWEREIDLLHSLDAVNKDLTSRLADSHAAISNLMDQMMTPAMDME